MFDLGWLARANARHRTWDERKRRERGKRNSEDTRCKREDALRKPLVLCKHRLDIFLAFCDCGVVGALEVVYADVVARLLLLCHRIRLAFESKLEFSDGGGGGAGETRYAEQGTTHSCKRALH